MPVDVLNERLMCTLKQRYSNVTQVHMAKNVSCSGIHYTEGMLIVHGSVDGLPEFNEILKLRIHKDKFCFLVKPLCTWYREHYRGFELTALPNTEVALIELGDFKDPYPLVDYMVGGLRMVSLRRFIIIEG